MKKRKDLYNELEWSSQNWKPLEPYARIKSTPKPIRSGTRVAFKGDLEALLSYDNPPVIGESGTVIKLIRASHMGVTPLTVHVRWDSGIVSEVFKEHLILSKKTKIASSHCKRYANENDIFSHFMKIASEPDMLVHKATNDYWSLSKEGDDFVLERLFDEDGSPLTK